MTLYFEALSLNSSFLVASLYCLQNKISDNLRLKDTVFTDCEL